MFALSGKSYTTKSQCSNHSASERSFFGNSPFYHQELPIDLLQSPKQPETKYQPSLTKEEFSELEYDDAVDVLYDLLSETFDKFVKFTNMPKPGAF